MTDAQKFRQKINSEFKCKYCKKKVNEYIQCDNCKACYHSSCSTRVEIQSKSEKFICCETDKSEVRTTNSTRKNSEKSGNFLDMDENRLKEIIKESFIRFLNPVEQKIEKKINELGHSIQFMSESFEEQKRVFEIVLEDNKALQKENENLKMRMQTLEGRMEALEAAEKSKNLIVAGVPKQPNLDTVATIKKIFTSMQLQTSNNEILESFRVNKSDGGPILVKMNNEQAKKDALKRIKDMKGITSKKCGLDGDDKKIYFNEDMSLAKRVLFKATRDLRKQKNYKAAFYVNGTIFLRINENEQAIKIRCEADLEKYQ